MNGDQSTCIDLRERFGDRYRVTFEESYFADLGKGVRRHDPWLMVIPCTGGRGHIYPWGGSHLAASVDKPGVARQFRRLPFVRVVQDGDDGATFVFDAKEFDTVAAIMKPRRRRRLSADQRAANAARLRKAAKDRRGAVGADKLTRDHRFTQ